MKSSLIALLLATLMLLASPVMALANHNDQPTQQTPQASATYGNPRGAYEAPQSCCRGGASPWASESPDTFKSNSRAGYQGSDLPPSTGYNPDKLDRYSNPMNNRYDEQSGFRR